MIKVPVRFAGNGVIKCLLKTNSLQQKLIFHTDKVFTPDFVDGNLFSPFISIPVSNMGAGKKYKIKEVSGTSHDFEEKDFDISVELINTAPLFEGQVGQITLKMKVESDHFQEKCLKPLYKFELNIEFDFGVEEKLDLEFRCRSSKESFLFTFLDHDGSVQQAAAVKPLKPCVQESCPVMLTLHGTGIKLS